MPCALRLPYSLSKEDGYEVSFSEAAALRKMEARNGTSIAYKYVDGRWKYQQHLNVSTAYELWTAYEPVNGILVA